MLHSVRLLFDVLHFAFIVAIALFYTQFTSLPLLRYVVPLVCLLHFGLVMDCGWFTFYVGSRTPLPLCCLHFYPHHPTRHICTLLLRVFHTFVVVVDILFVIIGITHIYLHLPPFYICYSLYLTLFPHSGVVPDFVVCVRFAFLFLRARTFCLLHFDVHPHVSRSFYLLRYLPFPILFILHIPACHVVIYLIYSYIACSISFVVIVDPSYICPHFVIPITISVFISFVVDFRWQDEFGWTFRSSDRCVWICSASHLLRCRCSLHLRYFSTSHLFVVHSYMHLFVTLITFCWLFTFSFVTPLLHRCSLISLLHFVTLRSFAFCVTRVRYISLIWMVGFTYLYLPRYALFYHIAFIYLHILLFTFTFLFPRFHIHTLCPIVPITFGNIPSLISPLRWLGGRWRAFVTLLRFAFPIHLRSFVGLIPVTHIRYLHTVDFPCFTNLPHPLSPHVVPLTLPTHAFAHFYVISLRCCCYVVIFLLRLLRCTHTWWTLLIAPIHFPHTHSFIPLFICIYIHSLFFIVLIYCSPLLRLNSSFVPIGCCIYLYLLYYIVPYLFLVDRMGSGAGGDMVKIVADLHSFLCSPHIFTFEFVPFPICCPIIHLLCGIYIHLLSRCCDHLSFLTFDNCYHLLLSHIIYSRYKEGTNRWMKFIYRYLLVPFYFTHTFRSITFVTFYRYVILHCYFIFFTFPYIFTFTLHVPSSSFYTTHTPRALHTHTHLIYVTLLHLLRPFFCHTRVRLRCCLTHFLTRSPSFTFPVLSSHLPLHFTHCSIVRWVGLGTVR